MRAATVLLVVLTVLALSGLSGCGTARGFLSATRSLGDGILTDLEGTVDGISVADERRSPEAE
jgi:predicted small secreted protein|tara:strand:+ start:1960 stop:2148 length:189 start_codon:yes stop_codon:yes gene_type:complete